MYIDVDVVRPVEDYQGLSGLIRVNLGLPCCDPAPLSTGSFGIEDLREQDQVLSNAAMIKATGSGSLNVGLRSTSE